MNSTEEADYSSENSTSFIKVESVADPYENAVNMSNFVLTERHLREVLIFCFNWKKSAAEARRMLVQAYGDNAPTDKSCREWYRRFTNGDFSVEDKPKRFKELEALLDEDPSQTREQLGMMQKQDEPPAVYNNDHWVEVEETNNLAVRVKKEPGADAESASPSFAASRHVPKHKSFPNTNDGIVEKKRQRLDNEARLQQKKIEILDLELNVRKKSYEILELQLLAAKNEYEASMIKLNKARESL